MSLSPLDVLLHVVDEVRFVESPQIISCPP